ncbi:MAG: acylphosphatase [Clostridia bacterium]|nr:acylphosphatase [Clostridia bacterium]
MTDAVRLHILFYGRVQGVGFRYRACNAALKYGCTGWVRNNIDGSVEMEIQGKKDDIDSVVSAIEKGRYVHIDNITVKEIPVTAKEYGFNEK